MQHAKFDITWSQINNRQLQYIPENRCIFWLYIKLIKNGASIFIIAKLVYRESSHSHYISNLTEIF